MAAISFFQIRKRKMGVTELVFLLYNKIGQFLTHSIVKITQSELSAIAFELSPLIWQSWKKLNQTKVFG